MQCALGPALASFDSNLSQTMPKSACSVLHGHLSLLQHLPVCSQGSAEGRADQPILQHDGQHLRCRFGLKHVRVANVPGNCILQIGRHQVLVAINFADATQQLHHAQARVRCVMCALWQQVRKGIVLGIVKTLKHLCHPANTWAACSPFAYRPVIGHVGTLVSPHGLLHLEPQQLSHLLLVQSPKPCGGGLQHSCPDACEPLRAMSD